MCDISARIGTVAQKLEERSLSALVKNLETASGTIETQEDKGDE